MESSSGEHLIAVYSWKLSVFFKSPSNQKDLQNILEAIHNEIQVSGFKLDEDEITY